MKAKKDGRYLNCYIDRKLLDEFEVICDMLGKTKTKVLEEAMQNVVTPYYTKADKTLNIKDGYYLKGLHQNGVNQPISSDKVPCKIIDHIDILGVPYVKIWMNSQFIEVPADCIEE